MFFSVIAKKTNEINVDWENYDNLFTSYDFGELEKRVEKLLSEGFAVMEFAEMPITEYQKWSTLFKDWRVSYGLDSDYEVTAYLCRIYIAPSGCLNQVNPNSTVVWWQTTTNLA